MFSLHIVFNSFHEMQDFVNKDNKQQQQKEPKVKKEGDKRGANVKELHKNAKIYQQEHPELKYKECLKLANNKNN